MTLNDAQDGRVWLHRAARRASRQRLARLLLWAAAAALGATWIASLTASSVGVSLAVGGAVGVLAGGIILFVLRAHWQVSATDMADHLDQRYPYLENSTRLLLIDDPTLTEQMQRRRVLDALRRTERLDMPRRPLAVAGGAAVLVALLCGAWWAWGPNLGGGAQEGSIAVPMRAGTPGQTPGLPTMMQARVTVMPPAYTNRPTRQADSLSLTVLEGSTVQWQIAGDSSVTQARILLGGTDTLHLAQAEAGDPYEGAAAVSSTTLYTIELANASGATSRSDYYALRAKPDVAPTLTRLEPDARTAVSRADGLTVDLRYAVDDDLGLASVRAVGTVARGSGENVKFREEAIALDRIERTSPTAWTVRTTLDAEALGMEMGDELYLHLEASDTRAPRPNRTRSETIFIVWPDTARGALAFESSLALPSMPEYFRSQRQIIIDTEKLIEQRDQMSADSARAEANRIGVDQKVLRLRYGKFLGEEMDSGIAGGGPGRHDDHAEPGHDGEGHANEGGHAHEDEHQDAGSQREAEDVAARYLDEQAHDHQASGGTNAPIPEEYAHFHDTAEQATFYSSDVRRDLKAVLAQMWEAELRLRTNRPEEALPYEHRALRMLKALQHKARVYVKRIGFEPPPLKPEEQRLSGDLEDVDSQTAQTTEEDAPSMPGIRAALAILQRPRPDTLAQQEIEALNEAARELAAEVSERGGQHIEGLGALRALIDEAEAGPITCGSCMRRAVQTFWAVLPDADAVPSPRPQARTPLHRQYIDALDR